MIPITSITEREEQCFGIMEGSNKEKSGMIYRNGVDNGS